MSQTAYWLNSNRKAAHSKPLPNAFFERLNRLDAEVWSQESPGREHLKTVVERLEVSHPWRAQIRSFERHEQLKGATPSSARPARHRVRS